MTPVTTAGLPPQPIVLSADAIKTDATVAVGLLQKA